MILSICAFASCASNGNVNYRNGDWNDKDVQVACNKLLKTFLESKRSDLYVASYMSKNKGQRPRITVVDFKNVTLDPINTEILSEKLRTSIENSKRFNFVEDPKEKGINLSLRGDVRSLVINKGKRLTRFYHISANIVNAENERVIWAGSQEVQKPLNYPAWWGSFLDFFSKDAAK
ncbi:MAG: hypothetical protein Ta2G_08020 [Termitinemataceae bacterium]|nr:MAG: hypothetical protein Ta2G_08020 [Termitinemataceae bacterium]